MCITYIYIHATLGMSPSFSLPRAVSFRVAWTVYWGWREGVKEKKRGWESEKAGARKAARANLKDGLGEFLFLRPRGVILCERAYLLWHESERKSKAANLHEIGDVSLF